MTQEQLQQIAAKAQDSILSSIDTYVQSAAEELGIADEISDSEWEQLV
jgi:hypothetical protein